MRPEEADTLARFVLELGLEPGAVCLNIGSSTSEFRTVDQPHIEARFIAPLKAAGIRFVHCDMKAADGVDEVGDVLDPSFRASLMRYRAKLIVCSNLLEHLTRPKDFAEACGELVVDGGHGLFSVPLSYPYHPDPIDTLLRLKPRDLAALLPGWIIIRECELEAGNYWQEVRATGRPFSLLARQLARVALPFYRPRQWRPNASRLRWLLRPYKVSIVLLEKPRD
jgi:hypothetical protein